MSAMTDPHVAMVSFVQEFKKRRISVQKGDLDPDIYVHFDSPALGVQRFSYVTLKRAEVAAFATFVLTEPLNGVPCFQVGYAVPQKHRGQGHAKHVLEGALAELHNGFRRAGIPRLAIEAVVGADNPISMKVASRIIDQHPKAITDEVSGSPAFQYVRMLG